MALAHHQIWADFVLQGRITKLNPTNSAFSAHDQDILIVFEDDAVIAVKNVTNALFQELSDMSTDLLFLGWCYGRRNMPMVGTCILLLSIYTHLSFSHQLDDNKKQTEIDSILPLVILCATITSNL